MSILQTIRRQFGVHATYHQAQTAAEAIDSPYVRTTYPAEWIARYLLAGYIRYDPIALAGFKRVLPFEWSEIEVTPDAYPLMMDFVAHGLGTSGFSVPILDRLGRRALFSVNSHLVDHAWADFMEAHREELVEQAHVVHKRAVKEVYGEQDVPALTAREREVLHWTARGKDYRTVAEIIGLSPHTAKAYLKSARYKLDCTTLAQAVAKAIKLRLILP